MKTMKSLYNATKWSCKFFFFEWIVTGAT